MDFGELEEKDGLRFSWNSWPSTRIESSRLIVPLGAVYTPLKEVQDLAFVQSAPIRCKNSACGAVLNPYCQVEFMNKFWVCPFCLTRNHFPSQYHDISPDNLPVEVHAERTTVEYVIPENTQQPPVFLFVVDTCTIEEELQQVKDSLLQSLMLLPEDSYVGLITFGKNVHVHELGFSECPKSYVFRGDPKDDNIDIPAVMDVLGTNRGHHGSFLLPVAECEYVLSSILEDLSIDPWPVLGNERPARCTGVAVAVGLALLELSCKGSGARLMLFAAGPPSVGPGRVIGLKLEETIRSHHDLYKGNAPWFNKAVKFFESLSKRAVENSHVVDIFACSLDQIGVAEMKVLVEKTGGLLVLNDMFEARVFVDSFQHVFRRSSDGHLAMGFNGEIELLASREFKVNGCIGPVTSMNKNSSYVGDKEIGVGGTSVWSMGGLDNSTTLAFYFDIVNQQASKLADGSFGFCQFLTKYHHSSGQTRLRVTTVAIPFVDSSKDAGLNQVRVGFDQSAATALMAKWSIFKAETEFAVDILRWLDRMLIRLVAKFGDYQKDRPESFSLSPEFSFFPQFMFHLRRSQFLQVFNSSPDETAFYRYILARENVVNSVLMIQPSLMAYTLEGPPFPVHLDAESVTADRILMLDTFFHVVIWHGEQIAEWKRDRIQEDPNYAYFGDLLKAPHSDAEFIFSTRFPTPMLIVCDQNDSQSRFLRAKLNPSITHNTPKGYGQSAQPTIFTDDVSLKVFLEHLQKLAVQGNN